MVEQIQTSNAFFTCALICWFCGGPMIVGYLNPMHRLMRGGSNPFPSVSRREALGWWNWQTRRNIDIDALPSFVGERFMRVDAVGLSL